MKETKKEILETLKKRGPSLPVHISRTTDVDMIFASAFLSELVSNKKVKISNMKVGGSPIYYLPGQKEDLEEYFKYLGNREKEAFQRLKEKKTLDDEKEKPVIRVALRNLKDFADSLKVEKNGREKIYWKFYNISEEEARKRINGERDGERDEEEDGDRKKDNKEKDTNDIDKNNNPNNNLLEIKKKKQEEREEGEGEEKKKEDSTKSNNEVNEDIEDEEDKDKSSVDEEKEEEEERENGENIEIKGPKFVKRVITALKNKDIKILEEKEKKKREYVAIIKTDSSIGEIKFLCIGRDLKRISDRHISLMLQKSREENLPVYLITTAKKFTKKAKKYLKRYSGMINVEKI